MNSVATIFFLANAIALLCLSREWAPLPLLIGTCFMTLSQGIEVGPFTFSIIRMLIAVGVVRIFIRGEKISGKWNGLDTLMCLMAFWALTSSFFHIEPSTALVFRLGQVYNICGIYFLFRIFTECLDDAVRLSRMMVLLLVLLALEMLFEKMALHNLFSALGGVSEIPLIRNGRVRAQGPFAHAILAGTVGATCLPFMVGLWGQYRKDAALGILACFVIIFASSSSGPIVSASVGIGALLMWRWRHKMGTLWRFAFLGYVALDMVMKAPAYYLIARIDLSGGSTGWHRARLIESAIDHFNEWWLAGTDYTRHWMPTGVTWNPDHTDITNYYLHFGVIGGLPLMLLFIFILAKAFSFVGRELRYGGSLPIQSEFMIWSLAASLFAHAATAISVSYFDQSFMFLYLNIAIISSLHSAVVTLKAVEEETTFSAHPKDFDIAAHKPFSL